jgi:predicted kinase|tara:strand:+ start:53 stop:211 length:159 start_codon:yes stop_codon:yes gene_type:complete
MKKKIYKVSYYDEIEAQTEEKAFEILKKQITSDVEYGDFSVWEINESDNERG